MMQNPQFKELVSSPVTKIVGINTGLFVQIMDIIDSLEAERDIGNFSGQKFFIRALQYS